MLNKIADLSGFKSVLIRQIIFNPRSIVFCFDLYFPVICRYTVAAGEAGFAALPLSDS